VSSPEAEARLAHARAQQAEAERIMARERGLSSTGASSLDSVKDAEAQVRLTRAAVAEAEALLSHAELRSPFSGTVVETHVLRGDLAVPGMPLLAVESTEQLRAEGALPESLAADLRIGDPLQVGTADGLLEGRIVELSAAADPVARARSLKVSVPPRGVRSGQLVELLAPGPTASGLFVPVTALRLFGQMEQLFVVREGRAWLRLVRTGRSQGGSIEILAGVAEGEPVVVEPPTALRDGQAVIVQP
jgi:RND family efflux transporter MFP subunit